jgi:hypothetical protein
MLENPAFHLLIPLKGAGRVPIGNMNIKKEYVYSRTFRAADGPQNRLSAD